MELKLGSGLAGAAVSAGLNRTFMELKSIKKTHAQLA